MPVGQGVGDRVTEHTALPSVELRACGGRGEVAHPGVGAGVSAGVSAGSAGLWGCRLVRVAPRASLHRPRGRPLVHWTRSGEEAGSQSRLRAALPPWRGLSECKERRPLRKTTRCFRGGGQGACALCLGQEPGLHYPRFASLHIR